METIETDITSRKGAFIATASRRGWHVAADGDWGIQFTRPKIYKDNFFWIGAFLLIFGIGIFVWAWGFLDYLMRRDETYFVPIRDLASGQLEHHLRRLH